MHIHTFAELNGNKTAHACFDGETAFSDAKGWLGVAIMRDSATHVTPENYLDVARDAVNSIKTLSSWYGWDNNFTVDMPAMGEQGEEITLSYRTVEQ